MLRGIALGRCQAVGISRKSSVNKCGYVPVSPFSQQGPASKYQLATQPEKHRCIALGVPGMVLGTGERKETEEEGSDSNRAGEHIIMEKILLFSVCWMSTEPA